MKLCVVERKNKLTVIKTSGLTPDGCIGYLPPNTPETDFKFIIKTENGPKICKKKKSEWLKEQFSAVSE
jgi:hypothetical protein